MVTKLINNLKSKQMKLKRAKVMMLPTDDKTNIVTFNNKEHDCPFYHYNTDNLYDNPDGFESFTHQHLYITTDDEIKEGDWMIHKHHLNKIKRAKDILNNGWVDWYKIIATTDKSLKISKDITEHIHGGSKNISNVTITGCLPQPSKAFIEKYCKVGGIDKVDIEYIFNEWLAGEVGGNKIWANETKLKVNSHNEITIHPIKNSWTREEVTELLYNCVKDIKYKSHYKERVNNWIKENL